MNRFWIEMMQNKYFILPGIYLTIYKSNSCSKSKMHVKYEVDNFFHNWMHNWIYVLFIQLFNIAIVTFWTSRALTKLYKTFKWEWGAGGARSHLVPPPAVFTLLNILRIIWWYPHLITHHNTSSVTITQDVTCYTTRTGHHKKSEDLEMFMQPGNTPVPFSSNCSKSRCPLNINHNSSIIPKNLNSILKEWFGRVVHARGYFVNH